MFQTADEYEFNSVVYCHQMSPVATAHCLIAAASQSSTVKLIDLKCGSATHTLRGHKAAVLTLAWSTKDEYLVATGRSVREQTLYELLSSSLWSVWKRKNSPETIVVTV